MARAATETGGLRRARKCGAGLCAGGCQGGAEQYYGMRRGNGAGRVILNKHGGFVGGAAAAAERGSGAGEGSAAARGGEGLRWRRRRSRREASVTAVEEEEEEEERPPGEREGRESGGGRTKKGVRARPRRRGGSGEALTAASNWDGTGLAPLGALPAAGRAPGWPRRPPRACGDSRPGHSSVARDAPSASLIIAAR